LVLSGYITFARGKSHVAYAGRAQSNARSAHCSAAGFGGGFHAVVTGFSAYRFAPSILKLGPGAGLVRGAPALRSIPIIAVTSYALSGEEKKARAAGCDDYVPKHFSPRQLLAKIKQYLS
jgi:hypothetical protein